MLTIILFQEQYNHYFKITAATIPSTISFSLFQIEEWICFAF